MNIHAPVSSIVSGVMEAAKTKVGEALVARAAEINNVLDNAYSSFLGSKYASAMESVSDGLQMVDDLLDYADEVMVSASTIEWSYVVAALRSIDMDSTPVLRCVIEAYKVKIKRFVSPNMGSHSKLFVYRTINSEGQTNDPAEFAELMNQGAVISADLYALGASYFYSSLKERWVFDSLINPVVRPDLKLYMK